MIGCLTFPHPLIECARILTCSAYLLRQQEPEPGIDAAVSAVSASHSQAVEPADEAAVMARPQNLDLLNKEFQPLKIKLRSFLTEVLEPPDGPPEGPAESLGPAARWPARCAGPVSYTHLTLPTKA